MRKHGRAQAVRPVSGYITPAAMHPRCSTTLLHRHDEMLSCLSPTNAFLQYLSHIMKFVSMQAQTYCASIWHPGILTWGACTRWQDGRIWAMQLPFWRTKFCPAHAEDGTPKCAGCARMQPNGQAWVEVQKGRHLCLDCLDSVVVDTQDAQPLYNKVGIVSACWAFSFFWVCPD